MPDLVIDIALPLSGLTLSLSLRTSAQGVAIVGHRVLECSPTLLDIALTGRGRAVL